MNVLDAAKAPDSVSPDSAWYWENQNTKVFGFSQTAGWTAVPGAPAIGDHGSEFKPDALAPAEAEAILECGCRLFFPVAPVTGETLYCGRHDSWEKCRVPGGYAVKCETCDTSESHFGHNSTLALARARTHAFGKGSKRKKNPHSVLVGRYTETDIHWQKYEKGMN